LIQVKSRRFRETRPIGRGALAMPMFGSGQMNAHDAGFVFLTRCEWRGELQPDRPSPRTFRSS
jgi:hypothetical protein